MRDARCVSNPPSGEHEPTLDELRAELTDTAGRMREILAEIDRRSAPQPRTWMPRIIKGGLAGVAAFAPVAFVRQHLGAAAMVAAVGVVLSLTPSLAPYESVLPPQSPVAAPPLEPRPAPPTQDAEPDVEQGEPTAGDPETSAPTQTTEQQAPEGSPATTEPSRRRQPTPPAEPREKPSEGPAEPNGPPCLRVDVPPEVHVPTCLDDVDEVVG